MKTKIVLTALVLLGIALPALAADPKDLLEAAKNGDVGNVQAALKAGVDINARFAIGKTAFIIAAEKGQDGVVDALITAGADVYVLDTNHWDAMAHAAANQRVSTMKLMLSRGFDQSQNNWRALQVMRSDSTTRPIAFSGNARLKEALALLEDSYKRQSGGPLAGGIPARGAAPTSTPVASVPAYKEEVANPILLDISDRKITAEQFRAAAANALQGRGWKIIGNEADALTGSLQKDREYRARITFKEGAMIKIAFVEAFGSKRPNWLVNLREDLGKTLGM